MAPLRLAGLRYLFDSGVIVLAAVTIDFRCGPHFPPQTSVFQKPSALLVGVRCLGCAAHVWALGFRSSVRKARGSPSRSCLSDDGVRTRVCQGSP
eukprot:scaffold12630_cov71-Phaeocystis_antarctica.AAC.5